MMYADDCVYVYPCRPSLQELFTLFFANLEDSIPSVRQGAAAAIANVVKAYGKLSISTAGITTACLTWLPVVIGLWLTDIIMYFVMWTEYGIKYENGMYQLHQSVIIYAIYSVMILKMTSSFRIIFWMSIFGVASLQTKRLLMKIGRHEPEHRFQRIGTLLEERSLGFHVHIITKSSGATYI